MQCVMFLLAMDNSSRLGTEQLGGTSAENRLRVLVVRKLKTSQQQRWLKAS